MAKDITESTPIPKTSEAKSTEVEMMTIEIDPEETHGGLWTNEIREVGTITLPKVEALDRLRRIKEYKQINKKLSDPSTFISMKSSVLVENQYLAPREGNEAKVASGEWSQEFGTMDPRQWEYVSEPEKKRLRALKEALTGYKPKL